MVLHTIKILTLLPIGIILWLLVIHTAITIIKGEI